LLGVSLLGVLTAALHQWSRLSGRTEAVSRARFLVDTMASELRQAVPCPLAAVGWRSVSPPISSSGVLLPNEHQTVSSELVFTEPDPEFYDPLAPGWDETDPRNYRRVRYYVEGRQAWREAIRYDASGAATREAEPLGQADRIVLAFTWRSDEVCDVAATVGQGPCMVTYSSRCLLLGR
jgi:hypothetical protein